MTYVFDEEAARKQAATDNVQLLSTGLMVVRDGKVLVVKRAEHDTLPGMWELPGGSVDEGETIIDGAVRELFEETGLRVKDFLAEFEGMDYVSSKNINVRQINYLVDVYESEIKLDPEEHSDYRFIDLTDLDTLECTDNQRRCIRAGFATIESHSYKYPMDKTEIANHYVYSHGYLWYDNVKVSGLPKKLVVDNVELVLKDKFHITLIWTEKIAKLIDANRAEETEEEVLNLVIEFIKTKPPVNFQLTGEFRFCHESGDSTVIALCNFMEAEKIFELLREKYKVDIPTQPFHITLYTEPDKKGIGILSKEHLEKISKQIQSDELSSVSVGKP